jgi:dTDP-4-amino-4,6-dideoxygalactose transaminase
MDVPFNLPFLGEKELSAVTAALASTVLHGDGPVGRRVEAQLRNWLGVRHALLTTSCTHALEMAAIVLDLGPGDEVIMPSFTFVSTANAVMLRGARPVFAEIQPSTLQVDPEDIAQRITPNTRAIIPVHYAGVACDMGAIMALADEHHLHVIEDAAHGVDGYYEGRPLGTMGHIGCFSFHDTKNISCGEGGAFLTNDDEIARRAELVREKGTNRSAFLRGEIDHYSWVSRGSSYVQSDLLAALLEVQLTRRKEIRDARERVWKAYYEALRPLCEAGELSLPEVPPYARPNFHIFFFRVGTRRQRACVLSALRAAGIQATSHYVPLHSSSFAREQLGCTEDLPLTTQAGDTLVRLPIYPQLADGCAPLAAKVAEVTAGALRPSSIPG